MQPRTHCGQAPTTKRAGTVLAASSHHAAPCTHRAVTYRAQPVRQYAALSAACTALHGACPLRVRRHAHHATPCIKIKIVLFFLNAVQTFPVSVRYCAQCTRRVRGACTVDTVHTPCIKRRKCKPTFICIMTSLSYGRAFCLESQKIDGTEYLRDRPTLRFLLNY